MHTGALFVLMVTASQAHPANQADPKECVAVLEDMGRVGLRISDAQAVASDVMTTLRKRMGYNRLVFEGTYKGQLKMKRMLGPGAENEMQNDQLAYFKAAMENAKYKVRARFGHKGKKTHWIELSCRKADSKPKDTLDKKRFEATSFKGARKKMNDALPEFCTVMDPEPAAATAAKQPGDTSGPLPPKRNKKKKKWTMPPRRD